MKVPQKSSARNSGTSPTGGLKLQVVLIGNYARDEQESMNRFAAAVSKGLQDRGLPARLLTPPVIFGRLGRRMHAGLGKWLGYLDKYVLFPIWLLPRLWLQQRQWTADGVRGVIHICDHSNSVYSRCVGSLPLIITCHDLLAVRGALGEATDCPASLFGKILQHWIRRGLSRASIIPCVSTVTREDVERLIDLTTHDVQTCLLPIGLNYPYQQISEKEAGVRLASVAGLRKPFLLHVGSNLPRKNRVGVLRIFHRIASSWKGQLVFAGQRLTPELNALVDDLDLAERVVQVAKPTCEVLEALYNEAFAFLFPSRYEGFGWPVIEAQSCGCPVLCSTAGPFREVAGASAIMHETQDEAGFADSLLELENRTIREQWRQRGLANATSYSTERMIDDYLKVYETALQRTL